MKEITLFFTLCFCLVIVNLYPQGQLNQKISNEVKRTDLKLNEVYQRILSVYASDAVFIKNLKDAQRLWIKMRDIQIEAKYPKKSAARYGDSLLVYKSLYLTKLTEGRTTELQEWLSENDQSVDFVNAMLPWYSYNDGLKAAAVSGKKILLCILSGNTASSPQWQTPYFRPDQRAAQFVKADRFFAQFIKADQQFEKYLEEHFILIKFDIDEDTWIDYKDTKVKPYLFLQQAYQFYGSTPIVAIFCESNGKKIDVLSRLSKKEECVDAIHYIAEEMYHGQSLSNYLNNKRQKAFQPAIQQKVNQPLMQWYSYTDGFKKAQDSSKKILLNAHGNWSPYCIKMNTTYEDKMIKDYVTQYFIPIKVDIDAKDTFLVHNKSLNAYSLLRDELKVTGYPSTLFFSSSGEKIDLISGYFKPDLFIHILRFFAEEKYKTTTIDLYLASLGITEKISK